MINLVSKINILNENDYKEAIELCIKTRQKIILFYLNSQVIYEAHKDTKVEKLILNADYLIADGYGIVWTYKNIFNTNIQKVVFTYSYFNFIRDYFIKNNASVFFLGATNSVLEKAVTIEKRNYPNYKIVGFHHGYFNKTTETDRIINIINKSYADVLIVGMGCPISEKWIMENKEKLNTILIFSVGGFFDFLGKDKIMAPDWMYNSGFEWVFRLIQEPKRLFKRYLFANSYLLFSTLKIKIGHAIKRN